MAVAISAPSTPNRPWRLLGRALVWSGLLAWGSAQAGNLDTLKHFLESSRSLRADFSQTVMGKSGHRPQASSGVMMFARPGRFRWQIEKPYAQLMVGDGSKVWIYDPDLKQVTVKRMGKALGATPAALLAGDNALEKNFVLSDGGSRDGLEWVDATPKSADSGFEKVRLGFQGDSLKAMDLLDSFGQTTHLVFQRLERNPSLPASLFHFSVPAGADVVGE